MLQVYIDNAGVMLRDKDVAMRIDKDELKLTPERREVLNRTGYLEITFLVSEASKTLDALTPIHTISDYEIGREYEGNILNENKQEGLVVVNTKDNSVFSVVNETWKWGIEASKTIR